MSEKSERIVVAKFGGTSVVKYPEKIKEIAAALDADRKFIVVSAPGKKRSEDEKLTDILLAIADGVLSRDDAHMHILEKFESIGIPFETETLRTIVDEHLDTKDTLSPAKYRAHVASLGEHLSGLVYADYLGATYLDPRELFVIETDPKDYTGKLDFAASQARWDALLPTLTDSQYVVPGFYGADQSGATALFSRGGSDLSGAYIAYFTEADAYENYTDFPILAANPTLMNDPKQLDEITFKELRDLTYSGFAILHHDVVRPLAERNIPIEIRATAHFPQRGTLVREEREPQESILGIAFAEGFVPINLYMPGLHEQTYILADTLTLFKELGIPIEHVSTGIDDVSVIVRGEYFNESTLSDVKEKANSLFGNGIEATTSSHLELGLLTVVGEGMRNNIGISGEIQQTLAGANINIYAIDQSITERAIIYCIETERAKDAIESIYRRFIAD